MTRICFDLETAGLRDDQPDIQLAAVAIDHEWNELASFERKIQFDLAQADPVALKINHWSEEVWTREAKPLRIVCQEFAEFLRPYCEVEKVSKAGRGYKVARLFGHNAATFDGPRIQRMFGSVGVFLPADLRVRCTLQRALWYFDERGEDSSKVQLGSSLTVLCEHFGIPVLGAHDALGDVRMTVALARVLKS